MTHPLPDVRALRALLIDAGGVLVRPNCVLVAEVLRRRGVEVDPQVLRAAEVRARFEMDRPPSSGLETDAERGRHYFDLVLDRAGVATSNATAEAIREVEALQATRNIWDDVPDGVRDSLRRFRRAGLRLAVVSNANGTVHSLFERLGLLGEFDAVLDSAVEGVEKPDPRLFRLALARLGAEPGEALHVGDTYHVDVVGARRAGLSVVLVDEAGLHPEADCPRVRSLLELARRLLPEASDPILVNSETAR